MNRTFALIVSAVSLFSAPFVSAQPAAERYWNPWMQPGPEWRLHSVTVRNKADHPVHLYFEDRFGRWIWNQEIAANSRGKARSPSNQRWIVANRKGRPMERFRVESRDVDITVGESNDQPRTVTLQFENRRDNPLFLYSIDRWGRWQWVGIIETGRSTEVSSLPEQRWLVTNRRGKILKEFAASRDNETIRLD